MIGVRIFPQQVIGVMDEAKVKKHFIEKKIP